MIVSSSGGGAVVATVVVATIKDLGVVEEESAFINSEQITLMTINRITVVGNSHIKS